MRTGSALTLFAGLIAATCGCRDHHAHTGRAVIGSVSISVPEGFARKAYEQTREQILNIPGAVTDQVFASWEGPGQQSFSLFYWSVGPPRDLGPTVAARRWKMKVAGQEMEVAETETFMGIKQQVLVTGFERPGGGGRFMMYGRNMPRETFEKILATMAF